MRATRWIAPGLLVLAVAPGLVARPSIAEQVVGGVAPPPGQGRGGTQPPPGQQQQPQQQKPPPPLVTTGLIVGRVVDADSGKPVAGATVQLSGGLPAGPPVALQPGQPRPASAIPAPPPRFLTDGEGRFAFRHLTRGNYTLLATKPGYAEGAYGRFRPGGSSRPIQLTDNERVGEISLRVFKYAVISGTVVDELGEPVVGAQLRSFRRVLQAGRRILTQFGSTSTDDRGQYRFGNLVPGEYVVALPMVSTSAPAGFTGDGRNLNLQLTSEVPGGSYYGFGGGRPVTADGRFLLQSTGAFGSQSIGAQPDASGRLLGYPTQYFQNSATASQATTVKVTSGEERMSVDLVMRLVPTANISGMLFSPEGPASNFVLHLVPSDSDTMVFDPDVGTAVTDQNGAFMFLAIPAGQYVIQTTRMPEPQPPPPPPPPAGSTTRVEQTSDPSGRTIVTTTTLGPTGTVMGVDRRTVTPPMLWTAMPIVVGGADVDGVSLTLREGYKISGRVDFTGGGERPPATRLAQIPISVEPADARQRTNFQQPGRVNPDGTFTVSGLLPGKYLVRVGGAPGGWSAQSVMAGGIDVSDTPLDLSERDVTGVVVTFTDRISDLRGLVRGLKADTEPPAVIVFPGDPALWKNFGSNPRRLRMSRASTAGNFSFGSMPPGEYLIVAIPDEYSTEWNDPGYLEQLARAAMRINLGEGEKKVQELEISNVRPPGSGAPAPLVLRLPAAAPFAGVIADAIAEPAPGHGPFVAEQVATAPPQVRDRTTVDPVGTGSIAGMAVDEASGQPIRRARVSARAPDMRNDLQAITDDQGRFSFGRLAPGPYTVVVSKAAYLASYYGATRPNRGPGTPIPIKEGQAVTGVVVRMVRGGVISGMVLDQYGQPFSGGRIRLMQVQRRDGERTLVGAGGSGTMTTDDRGIYRIYGLQPGQYVVGITPPTSGAGTTETRLLSETEMRAALADLARRDATPTTQPASPSAPGGQDAGRTIAPAPPGPRPDVPLSGRALGLATVYFPGTVIETDAGVVNLVAGQEATGIDFTLMYMPTSRIEGSIVMPDGQPATRAQLQLMTLTANSSSSSSVRMQGDGKFQAIGVAPGKYTLIGRQTDSGAPTPMAVPPVPGGAATYYVQQELLLNGDDIAGLVMTLAPTATLSGRVVFEGAAGPPPEVTSVRVSLEGFGPTSRIGGSSRSIQADKTGEFRMPGVTPGQYRLSASAQANSPIPLGWIVKTAALDGRDAYEQPFDVQPGQTFQPIVITMADQAAELTGTITDASGAPVTNLQVMLFPTDRTAWASSSRRLRGPTRPNPDGTYRFGGVRPGEYYMAAVTDLEPGDWGDPAFMEQLAAAALKLVFAPSEKKVQNLRTGG
jgi:protocatechuate 3,4-dioxygenase beta subunit